MRSKLLSASVALLFPPLSGAAPIATWVGPFATLLHRRFFEAFGSVQPIGPLERRRHDLRRCREHRRLFAAGAEL